MSVPPLENFIRKNLWWINKKPDGIFYFFSTKKYPFLLNVKKDIKEIEAH
jgi:hypothetical protein